MEARDRRARLDRFLAQQETQAYRMAYAMTQNREDALDLVQDSMLRLVRHYADRDDAEWTLLFYRILNNRIRDFHRRRRLWRWLPLFGDTREGDDGREEPQSAATASAQPRLPEEQLAQSDGLRRIHQALARLPLRQQQAFLMRALQEFSTRETAEALGISEASVKTHYRRALQQLRKQLADDPATHGETA